MPVVDASVLVALFKTDEAAHEACLRWLESAIAEPVHAPVILLAEIAAALSRGLDDPELAHEALSHILTAGWVRLAPVTAALGRRAAFLAAERRIRGCDAVYVALAEQLGTDLITLDRQQLERADGVIPTRRPGE